MPLYIDYRPDKLKDIVGNRTTVKALESILSRDKDFPHAYLLTGPSGCGKTTLARIVKDRLKCHKNDYREVDSADFRGIDTIREIRKNMRTAPMSGPCRVWLLDECHQLSKDAQNALLKALEDTPKHVYFILATTEPEKLIKTILNRCTTFSVSSLDNDEIKRLLVDIITQEDVVIPDKVIEQISEECLGSPRVALVILDKIIDMNEGDMEEAATQFAEEQNETIELCRALAAAKRWNVLSKILKNLKQEPETIRRMVLGYFSNALLNSNNLLFADILYNFKNNYFNSGKAGLILSCWDSIHEIDKSEDMPF